MNSMRVSKGDKVLQDKSEYAKYDVDGDGIVSDEEMKTIHAIPFWSSYLSSPTRE